MFSGNEAQLQRPFGDGGGAANVVKVNVINF